MAEMIISEVAILGILTIIHLLAIVFTWKVGRDFSSKSWVLIIIAFILLLFRRIMSFLDLFEIISFSEHTVTLIDRIYLPLVFWILICLGMLRIYYKIRSSIKMDKKLKSIKKKKK